MTSARETAIEELIARLGRISVANGYSTDAGKTLRVMENVSEGPGDAPALVHLLVGDDIVDPEQLENVRVEVPYDVHVIAPAGTPWQTVEAVVADVKRAVEQKDRTLNGALVARGLRRGSTRVHPREDGSSFVGAIVQYVGTFAEGWGNP